MSEKIIPLDSEHRIVVTQRWDEGGYNVENIKVERCWESRWEEPKWFEDHATSTPLIQAAWWASKWYHEKNES